MPPPLPTPNRSDGDGSGAEVAWSQWLECNVRVLRVGKSSSNSFKTLSEAIAKSRPTDRIELEGAEFFEAVTVHHCLEITSADTGDDPLISGRGPVVTIATDAPVSLSKLRIVAKGAKPHDSVAVLIVKGSPRITLCTLSSIHVANAASPTVDHCVITKCANGSGLKITDRASGIFSNSEISHHAAECVDISTSGSPIIRGCRIMQSRNDRTLIAIAGGKHGSDCTPLLEDNVISGTGELPDDPVDTSTFAGAAALLRHDSTLIQALIAITWGAAPIITSNTLVRGIVGIHIADSTLGEETFRSNRVILCSSWGMYIGAGSSVHCKDNDFIRNAGGVLVDNVRGTNVKAELSRFTANYQWGVVCSASSLSLIKCDIVSSAVGLGIMGDCRDGVFRDNKLAHNKSFGVHITKEARVTFERNVLSENSGVGIGVSDCSFPVIRANRVTESGASNVVVRKGCIVEFRENFLSTPQVHNLVLTEYSGGVFEHNELDDCGLYAHVAIAGSSVGTFSHNVVKKGSGAGFSVEDCACTTVTHNTISSVKMAVYVSTGADPLFHSNHVTTCGQGIVVVNMGLGTFTENNLRLCTKSLVHVTTGGDPTVRNNTMSSCSGVGLWVAEGGLGTIEKNKITACEGDCVLIEGGDTAPAVASNYIGEADGVGVRCRDRAIGIVRRNLITRMGKCAVQLESDATTLVEANDIRYNGGLGVLVTQAGRGSVVRNEITTCAAGGVRIDSGAAAHFAANFISQNGKDGLHIDGGASCTMEDDRIVQNNGCGVVVVGDSSATVCHRTSITLNREHGIFGALESACCFDDCNITANAEVGVVLDRAGAIKFEGCSISEHLICVRVSREGEGMLSNCNVTQGSKGLVRVEQLGRLSLKKCRLHVTTSSGIICAGGATVIGVDCVIQECGESGATATSDSHLLLTRSTFSTCNVGVMFLAKPGASGSSVAVAGPSSTTNPNNKSSRNLQLSAAATGTEVEADLDGDGNRSVLTKCQLADCRKAGAHFEARSSGVLRECVIARNPIGVIVENGSDLLIADTFVEYNMGDGIVVDGTPTPTSLFARVRVQFNNHCGVRLKHTKQLHWVGGAVQENEEGIVCEGGSAEIKNCTVNNQRLTGIRLTHGNTSSIVGCTLERNESVNLRVCHRSRAKIAKCTFLTSETGLLFTDEGSGTVDECRFATNSVGLSVRRSREGGSGTDGTEGSPLLETSKGPSAEVAKNSEQQAIAVRGSYFERNVFAIETLNRIKVTVSGCTVKLSSRSGISFCKDSVCEVTQTSFDANSVGLDVQSGAAGVCTESRFVKNGTGIHVEGDASTIIALNRIAQSERFGATIRSNSSIIMQENVFLRNGEAGLSLDDGSTCTIATNVFESESIGVLVLPYATPTVERNSFLNCDVGLRIDGENGNPAVKRNVFTNNKTSVDCRHGCAGLVAENLIKCSLVAGVASSRKASPQVVANVVEAHVAPGSCGLSITMDGAGTFRDNSISANLVGVRIEGASEATLCTNNVFANEEYGVVVESGGGGQLRGNSFAQNRLGDVRCTGTTRDLVIVGNAFASHSRSVVFEDRATGTVRHNLFHGQSGVGVHIASDANPEVAENLFSRGMDVGVVIAARGKGLVERNISVGCAVAVACKRDSAPMLRGNTLAYSGNHALVIDGGADPTVIGGTIGGGYGSKAAVVCRGGGSISCSLVASCGVGIFVGDNATTLVTRNRIRDSRTGILVGANAAAEVTKNNIISNETGLSLAAGARGVFTNNNVASNHRFGVVIAGPVPDADISGNTILGGGDEGAAQLAAGAPALVKTNTVRNNVNVAPSDMDRGAVPSNVASFVPKEPVLLKQFQQMCAAAGVVAPKAVAAWLLIAATGSSATAAIPMLDPLASSAISGANDTREDSGRGLDAEQGTVASASAADEEVMEVLAAEEVDQAPADASPATAPLAAPAFANDSAASLVAELRQLTAESLLKTASWRQLLPGAKRDTRAAESRAVNFVDSQHHEAAATSEKRRRAVLHSQSMLLGALGRRGSAAPATAGATGAGKRRSGSTALEESMRSRMQMLSMLDNSLLGSGGGGGVGGDDGGSTKSGRRRKSRRKSTAEALGDRRAPEDSPDGTGPTASAPDVGTRTGDAGGGRRKTAPDVTNPDAPVEAKPRRKRMTLHSAASFVKATTALAAGGSKRRSAAKPDSAITTTGTSELQQEQQQQQPIPAQSSTSGGEPGESDDERHRRIVAEARAQQRRDDRIFKERMDDAARRLQELNEREAELAARRGRLRDDVIARIGGSTSGSASGSDAENAVHNDEQEGDPPHAAAQSRSPDLPAVEASLPVADPPVPPVPAVPTIYHQLISPKPPRAPSSKRVSPSARIRSDERAADGQQQRKPPPPPRPYSLPVRLQRRAASDPDLEAPKTTPPTPPSKPRVDALDGDRAASGAPEDGEAAGAAAAGAKLGDASAAPAVSPNLPRVRAAVTPRTNANLHQRAAAALGSAGATAGRTSSIASSVLTPIQLIATESPMLSASGIGSGLGESGGGRAPLLGHERRKSVTRRVTSAQRAQILIGPLPDIVVPLVDDPAARAKTARSPGGRHRRWLHGPLIRAADLQRDDHPLLTVDLQKPSETTPFRGHCTPVALHNLLLRDVVPPSREVATLLRRYGADTLIELDFFGGGGRATSPAAASGPVPPRSPPQPHATSHAGRVAATPLHVDDGVSWVSPS